MTDSAPRPRQVSVACTLAGVGAALLLVTVAPMLADWPPTRFRYELESSLRGARFGGGAVSPDTVLVWLRRLLLAAIAGSVATIVLAVHAARRHNGARVALSVLFPLTALASLGAGVVGVLLTAAALYCAVLLWSHDARAWFLTASAPGHTGAGPVPPPPRVSASHSSKERPPAMSTQPPEHEGHAPYPGPSQPPAAHGSAYPPPTPQAPPYPGPSYPQQPSPAYGYGSYGGYGQPPVPRERPGTVTTAAIVTIVMAALTALGWAIIGIAYASAREEIERQLMRDPNFASLDLSADDLETLSSVVYVLSVVFVGLSALAIVMAVLVLKGRNWARIVLVVMSALTAVIALVMVLGQGWLALLWLAAAIAVIALLFAGGASAWFEARAHRADAARSQY